MPNIRIIYGAPGCGKTTRLMGILEEELKQCTPERIAFVSFTRKGTYEGVNRVKEKFGYAEEQLPWFRTLHSIAFRRGDFYRADMIGKKDYKAFSDAMGMKFTGYYTEDLFSNDDKYLFAHFMRRNNPTAAALLMQDLDARVFRDVETNYERYKVEKQVVDFTDIIEAFLIRDEALPVDVAIIDEAQDLTTLQWSMCSRAFRNCKRIYVAGDDDQAIYEWSGADVQHFLQLRGEREVLAKSWRLQQKILEFSRGISARIQNRVDKDFAPVGDAGSVRFYNDLSEVTVEPERTWYFVTRNNWFLNAYRDFLRKRAIVFMDKDKPAVDPAHIRAINLHEKQRKGVRLTERETLQLQKCLKPSGVNLTLPWFDNLNLDNDTIAYYKDLVRTKADTMSRNITVNTIHGVKGGEADNVVVTMDFTRAVAANYERNPDSELRVLYVACTRAKQNLHIVHSSSRNGYDEYLRMEDL